ncbi:MAG: T9SS type A sorting domain-containing protein [bacterium]
MKTKVIIFFILLIAGVFQLSAYKSILGNDTTKWSVYHEIPDFGETHLVYSFSDTNINTIHYQIMRYLIVWTPEINNYTNSHVIGYISEDTVTGICKILIGTRVDLQFVWREYTIMDLSLNKNDTFLIFTDLRYMNADTAIVDSVYYEDNRKIVELNQYHLSKHGGQFQKIKFIEGIGPSIGFPINDYYEYYGFILFCKFNNDILEYSTPDNIKGNCHYGFADVRDEFNDKHIIIYPNPSTEKVSIEISDFNAERLSCNVYNVLGQIIQSVPIISNITELKIEQIGFYYFIITDGKKSQVQKVIVERFP